MRTPNIEALTKDFPNEYKMSALTRLSYKLSPTIRTSGIECGEFVRLISGWVGPNGKWQSLSPLENKKALCIPKRIPQAGDAFIQEGGAWGHIGLVLRVKERADKTFDLDIVDANVKLDGVVRYRTINSARCFGFAPLGLKDKYATVINQHYMPMNNVIPPKYQYSYDICVLVSCIRACEYVSGYTTQLSVPQLFAELELHLLNRNASGKVLDWIKEHGLIHNQYNPLERDTVNHKDVWIEKAKKNNTKKRHKFNHELIVAKADASSRSLIKKELIAGNILIASTDIRTPNWDKGAKFSGGRFRPNHNILITGFNERDEWIIANHWEGRETGFLHPDFPLSWIYKVTK